MLDKMGKTDLGETAKAFGVIFVIGLVMTLMGGILLTLTSDDNTGFDDTDDDTVDSADLIKDFHQQGKGYVLLIAFWLPILGIIMIAVGIGVLSLGMPVQLAVLSVGVTVPLVLLDGIIPFFAVAAFFGAVVSLDFYSTITSKRFPKYEGNLIIGTLHKKMHITKTWIVYGVSYVLIFAVVCVVINNLYIVLSVFAATHLVACLLNMHTEKQTLRH